MKKWLLQGCDCRRPAGLRGNRLVCRSVDRLRGHPSVRLRMDWLLIIVVVSPSSAALRLHYWRHRQAKALEAALAESEGKQGDGKVLGERMTEALETLKRSSGKRNYLYDLPWYIIIGPPGAGKTTALVNSGLKFPLAGADGGKGDRRHRRHALLRLVVHRRGGADRHRRPLHHAGFRHRGRQAAAGCRFLDTAEAAPRQAADQRRDPGDQPRGPAEAGRPARSASMPSRSASACSSCTRTSRSTSRSMRCSPRPTWSPASPSISATSPRRGRRKVWGATFQTEDRKKNMVGEVPAEFDLLVRAADRGGRRPPAGGAAIRSRASRIFGFPAQFALLKERVADFLNRFSSRRAIR